MKKHFICGLSLIFLAIGLNSCGKTNTRKITNDWKIVSLEEEQKSTSVQADQEDYWRTSMTETTVSRYSEYTLMGVDGPYHYAYTTTGVVKANKITIKKDGTWEWVQELTFDQDSGGNPFEITAQRDLSGTWSFVGKTKGNDFSKNERVVFNILLDKRSSFANPQTVELNDSSEETTYLIGENTMTFTVKESTKKELQLEMESASNYSSSLGPAVTSNSKTLKMPLKERD